MRARVRIALSTTVAFALAAAACADVIGVQDYTFVGPDGGSSAVVGNSGGNSGGSVGASSSGNGSSGGATGTSGNVAASTGTATGIPETTTGTAGATTGISDTTGSTGTAAGFTGSAATTTGSTGAVTGSAGATGGAGATGSTTGTAGTGSGSTGMTGTTGTATGRSGTMTGSTGSSGTTASTGSASGTSGSTPATCTWGTAFNGNASFTWYYFGQGTAKGTDGDYQTACGYLGTEAGMTDTVKNTANTSPASDTYFAAIPGSNNFNTVNDCGACIEVTNGGNKIIATIIDECPTDNGQNSACTAAGHLDLSWSAWNALHYSVGNPSGTTWKFVACPVTGNIQTVPKSGNNDQFYIENTVFPVTGVSVNGQAATHLSYGVWQLAGGTNASGATVTLTDAEGHMVTGTVPGGGGDLGVQFPSPPGTCQ